MQRKQIYYSLTQRTGNGQIMMADAISFTGYQATIAVISLICLISVNVWWWFIIKFKFQFQFLEIKKYNPEFNILM